MSTRVSERVEHPSIQGVSRLAEASAGKTPRAQGTDAARQRLCHRSGSKPTQPVGTTHLSKTHRLLQKLSIPTESIRWLTAPG